MSLSNVDANLLFPLHVLLEEAHVERAAKRLHRSPSATSHILSRLCESLADPLLVRKGRVLVRSARGVELRPLLARLVRDVERVFSPPGELDLDALERTFRVATPDSVDVSMLGHACRTLAKLAPRAAVVLSPADADTLNRLRRGELDLAFYSLRNVPSGVVVRPLFRDHFVTLFRRGHPLAKQKLTLARFTKLDHVLVSPSGDQRGIVDRLLSERGASRNIRLVVPTFASALMFVAQTDYVTTVPVRMASSLIGPLRLVAQPPPLELPTPEVLLVWSSAADDDPGHRFFRDLIQPD